MFSHKYAGTDDNPLFHQLKQKRLPLNLEGQRRGWRRQAKPHGAMHRSDEQAATSVISWPSGDVQEHSEAYISNRRFLEIYNTI